MDSQKLSLPLSSPLHQIASNGGPSISLQDSSKVYNKHHSPISPHKKRGRLPQSQHIQMRRSPLSQPNQLQQLDPTPSRHVFKETTFQIETTRLKPRISTPATPESPSRSSSFTVPKSPLMNLRNRIKSGYQHFNRQEYAEAIEIWMSILREVPHHKALLHNVAIAYDKLGHKEKAILWLRKSAELDNVASMIVLGKKLMRMHEESVDDMNFDLTKARSKIEKNISSSNVNTKSDDTLKSDASKTVKGNSVTYDYETRGKDEMKSDSFTNSLQSQPNKFSFESDTRETSGNNTMHNVNNPNYPSKTSDPNKCVYSHNTKSDDSINESIEESFQEELLEAPEMKLHELGQRFTMQLEMRNGSEFDDDDDDLSTTSEDSQQGEENFNQEAIKWFQRIIKHFGGRISSRDTHVTDVHFWFDKVKSLFRNTIHYYNDDFLDGFETATLFSPGSPSHDQATNFEIFKDFGK